MQKSIFIILIISLGFFGCNTKDDVAKTIANIPVSLQITRFDQEFGNASPTDIPKLKSKYPFLFPEQFADSIWELKLRDSIQIELLEAVGQRFKSMEKEEADLKSLFQHIRHYFPGAEMPKVISLISDVDYSNRIILVDTLLLIGLDNYLGPQHPFYVGLPKYIASELDSKYLAVDVASAFAKSVVFYPKERSFLAQLIYYGQELYIKDLLLPSKADTQKIGYSQAQLEWARANEEQIWRYFVQEELLYSTDSKLGPRFLDPAPFSKFQLELDNESPGRIGRYMGWQIVRSFMKNNKVSLQQLLETPAATIFEKSNYKPRK